MKPLLLICFLGTTLFSVGRGEQDDFGAAEVPDAIIPEPRPTILGYLAGQPEKFTILATAASTVPGLLDTLNDTDATLTLFPPTDTAFFHLATTLAPDAGLEESDKEGIATALVEAIAPLANVSAAKNSTLASILAYHLLPEALPFQQLEARRDVDTAQGDSLKFVRGAVIDGDTSRPNPIANPRNVLTLNGWVHEIDIVLLPFNLGALLDPVETPSPAPDDGGAVPISDADDVPDAIIPDPRPTILGYLASMPETFGVLARAAATVPGLIESLDDETQKFTLFPPTDTAFFNLAKQLVPDADLDIGDKDGITEALATAIAPLANVSEAKFSTLSTILAYHLLGEARPFQELESEGRAVTAQGDSLKFRRGSVVDGDRSRPNPIPKPRNVLTLNGWIHTIDIVLLPFNLDAVIEPMETASPAPDDGGAVDISEADGVPDAIVPDPRPTILGYLASMPEKFGILARAAATVPGLIDTLDDETQMLTLFPPTDAAFFKLAKQLAPGAELDSEDKDGITQALATAIAPLANVSEAKFSTLSTILSYHLLGQALPFQKLESERKVPTAQGDALKFARGRVIDGDASRPNPVAKPRNILAKNGWVHVIDVVLLPFNLDDVLQGPVESPESTMEEDGPIDISEAADVPDAIIPDPRPTILGYLASLPNEFGVLARAAALVDGLTDTLDSPSARLTLFAPDDEAFTELANQLAPDANLEFIDKDGVLAAIGQAIAPLADLPEADFATLGSILAYHLVLEAQPFQELQKLDAIKTAEGSSLTIDDTSVIDADSSREDAEAFRRNVFALNGWVHVIDSVLLPFNLDDVLEAAAMAPSPMESPELSPEELPTETPPSNDSDSQSTSANEGNDDDDDDGVCFPGTARVRLADGSSIPMSSLRAGHAIHVGRERTSKVFAFTHKISSHRGYFYELTTASGHSVAMTSGHYVYANGALTAASAVRKGDVLRTAAGNSPVVAVRVVPGTGLFAPHTMHGDLEVNGVIVSGYSRALHPSIAHALLAPVRALSKYAGIREPLGSIFYNGADNLVPFLPKGSRRY